MPVFHNFGGKLKKLQLIPLSKERDLQKLIENNLLEALDMTFLATEYPTTDRGRIDTIAIDSGGAPVIIEYKRNRNDNVINQALSYLKWLKSQKVEFFEMLVIKNGISIKRIDWNNPRVICIAENYSKYDIDTLDVIPLKLELYKFHYYENDIFTLEKVNGEDEKSVSTEQLLLNQKALQIEEKAAEISLQTHLDKGQAFVQELFFQLQSRIFELDENIREKITNNYIGFRVSKTFLELHIQKSKILIYLRPIAYNDPEGKIHKVPKSYNWVLDRRVYVNNENDIDYTMKLIEQSYLDVL